MTRPNVGYAYEQVGFAEDTQMRRIRFGLLILSLIVFTGCVVLLLNMTAPNPTHRRYSSWMPLTNAPGQPNQVGLEGEQVLSDDLGIPRNDLPDQRQCFCRDANVTPLTCKSCAAHYGGLLMTRRPDFVTDRLIIESKNVMLLDEDRRDPLGQISDYAAVALNLGRPLWIYVRVNTAVDEKFYQLAESTGGGVVPYFTVPGYSDPIDMQARGGLLASGALSSLMLVAEVFSRRPHRGMKIPVRHTMQTQPTMPVPQPHSSDPMGGSKREANVHPPHSSDPVGDALDALKRAEDAVQRTRDDLNKPN